MGWQTVAAEEETTPAAHAPATGIWTLTEKVLAVATALLTLATAAITLLAVNTKSDLDTSEDRTGALQEDNEALRAEVDELTASVDDWQRRYERATTTTVPSGATPSGSSTSGGCGSSTSPEIWISPDEVPANSDFVLTIRGVCFGSQERLRISISESDYDCIDVTCTDIIDVEADANGELQGMQVTVYAAGNYQTTDPGTVYVVVAGEQERWASQPLRLT
jgi:hypothetical protein